MNRTAICSEQARTNNLDRHAHWLLRFAVASVFLYHGFTKFPQAEGLAGMMGMPLMLVYMLGAAELTGAILILAGGVGSAWLTRLGSLLLIPVMLGAIAMAHWPRWNFAPSPEHPMGGMEFQVVLLLVLVYLLVQGGRRAAVRA